jgi:hypothetical protein
MLEDWDFRIDMDVGGFETLEVGFAILKWPRTRRIKTS